MRIDLHVHLAPYSKTSEFQVADYREAILRHDLKAITVTDYGTTAGAAAMERAVGGVLVIYGLELQTHEGQFLVFSSDRKFLAGLPPRLRSLAELPRNDRTAVIWAHPRMPWSSGWRAPFPRQPLTKFIFQHCDGIEYYNGAMLAMAQRGAVEPSYHEDLREQIERWRVAAVGGSACQSVAGFLRAWTVFPRIRTTQDFITAIKDRAVRPGAQIAKPRLVAV